MQILPLPAWARDAAAVLLMDYTIYLWHVATHKVPWLWRFHLVHHIDLDLDTTTALRFHGADMAISAPCPRSAGGGDRGQPARAADLAGLVLRFRSCSTTATCACPNGSSACSRWSSRRPGCTASTTARYADETDSNWSSGFAFWDHLHRTFRLDVPQDTIAIGVPAYRDPAALGVLPSLMLPFGQERDAWSAPPFRKPTAIQ